MIFFDRFVGSDNVNLIGWFLLVLPVVSSHIGIIYIILSRLKYDKTVESLPMVLAGALTFLALACTVMLMFSSTKGFCGPGSKIDFDCGMNSLAFSIDQLPKAIFGDVFDIYDINLSDRRASELDGFEKYIVLSYRTFVTVAVIDVAVRYVFNKRKRRAR
uniref:hypothetical protein n=1 Tax=Methylobacterium sp. B34 TaxID=95563 RepID=UPI000FE14C68|nr:hypothetical protein [Methylobacterium sp. B34]